MAPTNGPITSETVGWDASDGPGFRHAPGCVHASSDADEASERDALLRLSLGRSSTGRHTDIYRCRECAAKGPLD
jgi:hypothetical protein